MKYLILLLPFIFLVTCMTTRDRYEEGQCLLVIDPDNIEASRKLSDNIIRIEKVYITHYVYRWWTYQKEWAISTNSWPLGGIGVLHHITEPVRCPDASR